LADQLLQDDVQVAARALGIAATVLGL